MSLEGKPAHWEGEVFNDRYGFRWETIITRGGGIYPLCVAREEPPKKDAKRAAAANARWSKSKGAK